MVNQIRKDTKSSQRLAHFFLRIQGAVAFIIVGILLISVIRVNRGTAGLNKSIKNIYQVTIDVSRGNRAVKDSSPEKIKQFYDWESNNFKYIVAINQRVLNINESFKDKYKKTGAKYVNDEADNFIQVNDNFFEHYSLSISEGRLFNKEDYILRSRTMPVILGNEYKEYAKLHERFKAEYMGEELDFEVIGFLNEGSYYMAYSDLRLLDKYIIMPSIEKVSNEIVFKNMRSGQEPKILDLYNKSEQYIKDSEDIS